jgi:hypothetical protein
LIQKKGIYLHLIIIIKKQRGDRKRKKKGSKLETIPKLGLGYIYIYKEREREREREGGRFGIITRGDLSKQTK